MTRFFCVIISKFYLPISQQSCLVKSLRMEIQTILAKAPTAKTPQKDGISNWSGISCDYKVKSSLSETWRVGLRHGLLFFHQGIPHFGESRILKLPDAFARDAELTTHIFE